MNYNNEIPSYFELVKINPLLRRRTLTEFDELVSTMTELGYKWDRKNLCFVNEKINCSIRTQGLDMFTAKSFREMHENLLDEINLYPELYHKAGKAYDNLMTASSIFIKFLAVLLTLGWFIFSFKTILFIALPILLLWLFLFIRAVKLNTIRQEIKAEIWYKNYLKRKDMNK